MNQRPFTGDAFRSTAQPSASPSLGAQPLQMLSSRLGRLSQRQCWRLLCQPQTTNIQLSQQDLLHWAAQGPDEPLTVTLQVPAQQLVATVTTSTPAEDRTPPRSKYYFERQSRSSRGKSGQLSFSKAGPAASRETSARSGPSEDRHPHDLQQFVEYLRTRSIHVRVWQSQNRVPTTAQLQAAERELQ